MTHHHDQGPILILGGTGKTGRRVAEKLTAREIPVRIGSRSASPAFDWTDNASWAGALDGVSAVYITYHPDLAIPGAAETVGAFAHQAVASGVKRLVLLSGRGEPEAQRSEQLIAQSGADWTVVRSSWFAQNFSETFMSDGIGVGQVVLPAGNVREPFIDAEDIADVVVAALTEDGHIGQIYEVTGPRLLTFAEAIGEIAKATGRKIDYIPVTVDDYVAELRKQEVPEDLVLLLDELFRNVLDGRNEYLADGVHRALGRQPRDFSDYAKRTAASGIWGGNQ